MRKTILALPLIAMAAIASPALAQDEADESFDGLYVGVSAGYVAPQGSNKVNPVQFDTNRDGDYAETVNTSTGANAFSPGFCPGQASGTALGDCGGDDNGLEYAGRIGFDIQSGNIVFGALVEGSKSKAVDFASAYSTTPAGYHLSRELDYAASVRGRLGFTPDSRVLMYATGGGSYARIKHGFSTTNTANSFTPTDDDSMVWGWQAGGGAEVKLAGSLTFGLEYLYNRYNDNKYYVAVGQGTAPATNPFLLNGGGTNLRQDSRFDFHTLRATVGLRF
jgi:outer membrane immunogenic protein